MDRKDVQSIIEYLYQDEIVANDGDIKKLETYINGLEEKIEELENAILFRYEAGGISENGFNILMEIIK